MTRIPELRRGAAALTLGSLLLLTGCTFHHFRASTTKYVAEKGLETLCCPVCPPMYCAHAEFFGYHETCWSSWPEGWSACPPTHYETVPPLGTPARAPASSQAPADSDNEKAPMAADDDQPPPPDEQQDDAENPDPNTESRVRTSMMLPRAMSKSANIPRDQRTPHMAPGENQSTVLVGIGRTPPIDQEEHPRRIGLPGSGERAPFGGPASDSVPSVAPASYQGTSNLQIPR